MSKKYTTNFLQDTNGSTGSANQVLISTSSGVDWVDGSGSSIIGGPYLPLAGGTMTGNVILNDNVELRLGTSSDFKMGHTGAYTYLANYTGDLFIEAIGTNNDLYLRAADNVYIRAQGNENGVIVVGNGAVQLYYNNVRKFETTNTGATVTGKISGLTAGTANTDAVNLQQLNDATTGALIFVGTWSAAPTTTSVLDGAISNDGTIVIEAANPGISVGATITGTGISGTVTVSNVDADGVTIAISSGQTIADGVTLTFTTVGGTPDLSQTSRKVTGHYYICETAGVATPNGASTTPNEWAVGDWVAFSDLATDAWQKIDNSSVLSGAGTGGSLAAWSGSGTSVTLQDAPATFSGNDTTFAGTVSATSYFLGTASEISLATTGSGNVFLRPNGQSTSGQMQLASTGNATFAGVLTGPSADLEFIKLTAANPGVLMKETDTTDKNWDIQLNSGNLKFYEVNDARSVFNQHVTFQAGGNVGIGVTGPSTTLEVAGHITINSPAGASQSSYGLRLRKTNSSSAVQAGGEILASPYPTNTNAGNLIFKTANASANLTQRMVIDGVGNVGIGTNAPASELHIESSDNPNLLITRAGVNKVSLGDSGSNNGGDLLLYNAAGTLTTLLRSGANSYLNGGNVGIGTTGPGAKLDVAGTLRTSDDITINNSSPELYMLTGASHFNWMLAAQENVNNAFEITPSTVADGTTFSTPALIVLHTGNVGIGTNSPSAKLEIGVTSGVSLGSQPAEPLFVSNNGVSVDGRVFINVKHDAINTAAAVGAGFKMTAGAVTSGTAAYFDSLIFLESAGPGSDTIHSAPKAIQLYVNNHGTAAGAGTDYQQLGDLAMTIAENAKVGIGNTAPSQKLHVGGNVRVTGAFYDSNNSPGTAGQVLSSTATGTDWVAASGGGGGTVTSVGSGAGLTGGAITGSGSLAVDYAGSDNVILSATDEAGSPIDPADNIIFSPDDATVRFANVSDLPFTNNTGTTTASNTQTFTNKSGNISQWTNNSGYTTATGTVTSVSSTTAGDALDVAVATSTTTPALAFTFAGDSTQYIDGAGDLNDFPVIPVVYTPDVWALSNPQTISNGTTLYRSNFDNTKLISGTTASEKVSGINNKIKVTQAGTYEISYDATLQTTYSIRQVILGYVEINDGIAQGSGMSNYLRVTGNNQGGVSSVSNTFYCVLAVNDELRFAFEQIGPATFTGMQNITIKDAKSGLASAFSIRRIA